MSLRADNTLHTQDSFEYLRNGKQKFVIKPYCGKYASWEVGRIITIDNFTDSFEIKIKDVHFFNDLTAVFNKFGIKNITPNCETLEEALTYHQNISKKDELIVFEF